jgi:hypothetical protein
MKKNGIWDKMQRRYSKQGGIALVLLVVSLVVILGAIGFAIDSYMLTITKTQYQSAADATALAALERFYEEYDPVNTSPGQLQNSVDKAIQTAQETLRQHLPILLTAGYIENVNSQNQLGQESQHAENGIIRAGKWITSPSQYGAKTGAVTPYFREYLPGTPGRDFVPNSFRIELKTGNAAPIKTTLLRLVGINSYTLQAEATSITTARRAAFLIDLSPSVTETTHDSEPDENRNTFRAEQNLYSYPIRNACTEGAPVTENDIYDYPLNADGGDVPLQSNPKQIYINTNRPKGGYRCVHVQSHNDEVWDMNTRSQQPSLDEYFAIDYQNAPEPLSQILTGIHYSMRRFKDRDVGGDRVGLFGFDDRTTGFLKVRSTKDGNGTPALVTSQSDEFTKMLCATRCPDPVSGGANCNKPYPPFCAGDATGGPPSFKDSFLFPQYFSNNAPLNPALIPNATHHNPELLNTNIKIALEQARDLLIAQPDHESSENFIILFTDGKSSCIPLANSPNDTHCGIGLNFFMNGINKVIDTAWDELAPARINLHIFLVGQKSSPHTVVRKGPNSCLDDITSRVYAKANTIAGKSFSYVDWVGYGEGPFGVGSGPRLPTPFFYPNRLYEAAVATGGLWLPLRPPCIEDVDLLHPGTDPRSGKLADTCNSYNADVGSIVTTAAPSLSFLNASQLDGRGRLFCDPEGRAIEGQINDFMTTIMNINPLRLVPNNIERDP